MIFVTVGSQLPFDRLIRAVDHLAFLFPHTPVIAQTDKGNFMPEHIQTVRFVPPSAFQQYMKDAELVISHAGMGTILTASQLEKKLIVFPRLGSLHEVRNNHQLATCKMLSQKYKLNSAYNEKELEVLLKKYKAGELEAMKFVSDYASATLISSLRDFIK